MVSKVVYSSRSEEWATPDYIFDPLNKEFKFTLDAAATKDNAKCKAYFDKEHDALLRDWTGNVYMNPPYGKQIGMWMKKARMSVENGDANVVVCLVHARTDTRWWWQNVMFQHAVNVEVRFVKGRVKFGGLTSAPFPSCVIIYRNILDDTPPSRGGIRF